MAKYCKDQNGYDDCEESTMGEFDDGMCDDCWVKRKLEYFREEILAERISTGEIAELQSLAEHIDKGDVLLLEWAGVCEHCQEQNCDCEK